MILFGARHLASDTASQQRRQLDPPLLYEVASLLNQEPSRGETIKIIVKARSYEQASRLGEQVAAGLNERLLGDPARIQTLTEVETQAPEDGAVLILAERL